MYCVGYTAIYSVDQISLNMFEFNSNCSVYLEAYENIQVVATGQILISVINVDLSKV
jgi:hypothetical protein